MHQYKEESISLIKLATPILIASVAQTGMSVVDTIMAGGVSAIDMAAVSIAASIWLPSILFGVGLLMALVPVVAQLNGANRRDQISFQIQQGCALAILISAPILLVLYQVESILDYMNVDTAMAVKTTGYIHAIMVAVPAYLLFQALRSFTDGMSYTKPAMIIGFIGLLVNIPFNWIFVYGKFGMPALGGVGCGIASAIVYWLMLILLFSYVVTTNRFQAIALFKQFHPPQLKAIARLFKLGLPVAAAIFFEVTLFAVVALLVAPLGSTTVAAHQIAMNFSSLVFMIPMSIGAATSIRVGYQLGKEEVNKARIVSRIAIIIGLLTAVFTAILTVIFRDHIAALYTHDISARTLAIHLLLFAAIYQCTDSIQAIAAGALRGYKDMRSIFFCTFSAYWLLGLPSGYILGRTDWIVEPMGASGFWCGFIIGLSSAALFLGLRLYWMHKQPDSAQLRFSRN